MLREMATIHGAPRRIVQWTGSAALKLAKSWCLMTGSARLAGSAVFEIALNSLCLHVMDSHTDMFVENAQASSSALRGRQRSQDSVSGRTEAIRRPWTVEEDAALIAAVRSCSSDGLATAWPSISRQVGTYRTSKVRIRVMVPAIMVLMARTAGSDGIIHWTRTCAKVAGLGKRTMCCALPTPSWGLNGSLWVSPFACLHATSGMAERQPTACPGGTRNRSRNVGGMYWSHP